MATSIPNRLKAVLLLHATFAAALGLLYLLAPVAWGEFVDWPPAQPFDHRIIGAAFLAFALASWLARRESSWDRVKIVVQLNIVFSVLATLLMAWGLVMGALPTLGWVYVVAVGGFALAFILSYFEQASA